MKAFPLIYGLRELVAGKGFIAGVELNGRALLRREGDEGWCVYGVEPGGVCGSGCNELEAYADFRRAFHEVLVDSAALTEAFDDFATDVRQIAAQLNEAWHREWLDAREAIRAGASVPEGVLGDLPRQTRDPYCGASVVRLDNASSAITPQQNDSFDLRTAA